jgi:hypothetical protein
VTNTPDTLQTAASGQQVTQRQAELANQWTKLLELKKYWDNAVKAIQCIDRFNLVHADVSDLLREKLAVSEAQEDVAASAADATDNRDR